MKLTMVGNGTAVHIYTEFTSKEITVNGRTTGGTTFRNTGCGALNTGSNFGRRTNVLSAVFEGTLEEVTCKRCLKSDAAQSAPVVEEAAPSLQETARTAGVDTTIVDRGHHYKVVRRWVSTRTGNLRVSVANEHGLVTTFGYPVEMPETKVQEETTMVEEYIPEDEVVELPAPVRARDAVYAMSMAAANRETVTQGHSDYCASHGHAKYLLPGGAADQGNPFCPRCGDKTTPISETIEVEENGPRRYEVFETICTGERKFLGTMHHYKASDEWVASKANCDRALINGKLEYKGPERAPELALYVGWWN